MKLNGPMKWKLGQETNYGTDYISIPGYILTYFLLLKETCLSSGALTEGTLIFLRPQCPITRTHLRERETESCNILNCSNNKIIYGLYIFFTINELLRDKVIAIWNSI